MILRIPYQYLPVLQHLLVTHLLQFPRMQFLLCNAVNTLLCCTYIPFMYIDVTCLLASVYTLLLSLDAFLESLWQEENKIRDISETKQSWDLSGQEKETGTLSWEGEGQGRDLEDQSMSTCWRKKPQEPIILWAEPRRYNQSLPLRSLKPFPTDLGVDINWHPTRRA